MNKRIILLITGILLILSVCGNSQESSKKDSTEIIILHTNDMHSKIDNMNKLAYLADSLRKIFPFVFLVSAGDNFTGNPVVDMVSDIGYPMIDLMNNCGFDISALGNHEFDMGQEFLEKRIEQASFPFICCNIDATGAILKQPRPFFILNAGNDITLAFLGIIQTGENGLPDSHPSKFTGIKFTEGITAAQNFTWLKDKYGIFIGLTHLGIETDEALAKAIPQFDLIIGGHSHTLIDSLLTVNGVLIVQAGSGLHFVGKTTLRLGNGKITDRHEEIICLDSIKHVNQKIQSIIDRYNDNKELRQVVGSADVPITGFDELGSLITDALRYQLKTDFAFLNRGGIRVNSLPAGDITISDIYKLDPFQNYVMTYTLSGSEIISLIRNAYNIKERIDLAVSGMMYTVITDSNNRCTAVEMRDNSGNPVDTVREYKVAINSYIASVYRFDHRDTGSSSGITSDVLLINYLWNVKKVNYSNIKRTFVKVRGED